jgi:hypothetical protein
VVTKGISSYVMCVLPKAGLGNQLFPLMKAVTFAHLHQLPLKIIGFHQIKIGPYIRWEKTKRRYGGYFTIERNIACELFNWIRFKYFNRLPIEIEPNLDIPIDKATDKIYLFNSFNYSDCFYNLKEHREVVVPLFWNILSDGIKEGLKKHKHPVIGVHIRMGDFRAEWRTPEDYFIKIIQSIRAISGVNLAVSVFTDGHAEELNNILALPNVTLVEGNRDIVDLILLSSSKIIIVSSGSTFGYWASFLSEAPLILPPSHMNLMYKPIRENIQKHFYEGVFDITNPDMLQHLNQAFPVKQNE